MSQKSEKYARELRKEMDAVSEKMDRWEKCFAAVQVEAVQDAQRERTYARHRQREAEKAMTVWKAVAYGSLAAASIVLALAIAKTNAKAVEQPQEMSAPPVSVISEVAHETPQSVVSEPERRFSRVIENATITHYCICEKCCGKAPGHPAYGITASGREAEPYYSVAVDPFLIELGTTLYLDFGDGELVECRADDTGASVNGAHIDLCVSDHQEALELGVKTAAVYIGEE